MHLTTPQLAAALDAISEDIEKAASAYQQHVYRDDEWAFGTATWTIQLAYTKLSVLSELLQLPKLHAEIAATLKLAKGNFGADDTDPDGESHLKWAGPARRYHRTLQSIFLTETSQTVTKDLEAIIRGSLYVITDRQLYGSAPVSEHDVHVRIQGVLRCVFPDLLNKPALSKPIKNFVPDTGIPSINSIVEYKFVSDRNQVGSIADEILADTRGYTSERWKAFLYVIYETERFKPEAEWRQLLRECGNAESVSVIVLNGASVTRKPRAKRKALIVRKRKALRRKHKR